MAIFYTKNEGGQIHKFDQTTKRSRVIRDLSKRRFRHYQDNRFYSMVFNQEVSSVFFTKNGRIKRIWDATTGEFRLKPKHFPKFVLDIAQIPEGYTPEDFLKFLKISGIMFVNAIESKPAITEFNKFYNVGDVIP